LDEAVAWKNGAAGEGDYVKKNGFGHEDWNFNYELAIDEYIYGYAYYKPKPQKKAELFSLLLSLTNPERVSGRGFTLTQLLFPRDLRSTRRSSIRKSVIS